MYAAKESHAVRGPEKTRVQLERRVSGNKQHLQAHVQARIDQYVPFPEPSFPENLRESTRQHAVAKCCCPPILVKPPRASQPAKAVKTSRTGPPQPTLGLITLEAAAGRGLRLLACVVTLCRFTPCARGGCECCTLRKQYHHLASAARRPYGTRLILTPTLLLSKEHGLGDEQVSGPSKRAQLALSRRFASTRWFLGERPDPCRITAQPQNPDSPQQTSK